MEEMGMGMLKKEEVKVFKERRQRRRRRQRKRKKRMWSCGGDGEEVNK